MAIEELTGIAMKNSAWLHIVLVIERAELVEGDIKRKVGRIDEANRTAHLEMR